MFIALEVSIEAIALIAPLADRIALRSASLADQLRITADDYAAAWAHLDRVLALTWPLVRR